MGSLAESARRHEDRILAHVDRLPGLADMLVDGDLDAVRAPLEGECAFLGGEFLPHIRAVEAVIYPELDRIMSCCHSMLGMRREHRELEQLVGVVATRCSALGASTQDDEETTTVRHALHRLASIARVHLAEEGRLIGVLERNLPAEQVDALVEWLGTRRERVD